MTHTLQAAFGASVGVHLAVLAGLPVTQPAQFDVERAPTSVELSLVRTLPSSVAGAPTAPLPDPEASVLTEPAVQDEVSVASETHRGALADVLPNAVRTLPPIYPMAARRAGLTGTVVLGVDVLASGRAGQVAILQSSGSALLDDAARLAIRQWVFRPARRMGQPVEFWVEIPVTFRLTTQ